MRRSGQPGAGEGKPRSHQSPGGILLFYFQPCFLRYKGLQIRCISEAYLCEYLTAYSNRTKTFKPSEVHPSRALSPHVTAQLRLLLGASCQPGLSSAHQLPISPFRAASWHYPGSPPWLPAASVMASALHAGVAARAAAWSTASQHPDGLHLCCCIAAHRLHPPHT